MATKSMKALKNLSLTELTGKARELRAALFDAKMKHATGQLANTASLWRMRKELAMCLMLQGSHTASKAQSKAKGLKSD
jgi:ribosomal protein L29